MNPLNGVARVLLIADDRDSGAMYRNALAAGGFAVTQVESFAAVSGRPDARPRLVVLCELAVLAYPAQRAQVLRVPAETTPAALVATVHRRVALRATLYATMAQAA